MLNEETKIFPDVFPRLDEIPDPGVFRSSRISGIVSSTALPRAWKREFELSAREWEKLNKFWSDFRGPVKSADHFFVPCLLDLQKEIMGVIEYNRGTLTFEIFEGPEERENIPWDKIPHPEPSPSLVSEARTGPNEKCRCGSGKKFKKCCLYKG